MLSCRITRRHVQQYDYKTAATQLLNLLLTMTISHILMTALSVCVSMCAPTILQKQDSARLRQMMFPLEMCAFQNKKLSYL